MSGITLDYEVADKITLITLKEALVDVNKYIQSLEERNVPEHLALDYDYHVKLRTNLQGVINYYGGYD
jgi:hypothetical protein